jgi:ribose transport system ATP-binding protein
MRNISKHFGPTRALAGVNFQVSRGEVHALVGENGAGKSTLMKILSGDCKADSGEIYLGKNLYKPKSPTDGRLNGIAMIYQELSLAPHLSVAENICLGDEPKKWGLLDREKMKQRAEENLRYFDHPEIKADQKVQNLSVNAQQLVEIARALALGCKILVFDEPTSSLSTADSKRLFEVIQLLKNQGISIIYISHFLEEVKSVADKLTVLRDGQVVDTCDVAATTMDSIVNKMVGRNVNELYPKSKRFRGKEILEIHHLAGFNMPKDVSLKVNRGEIVGIFGLIGAGRTEFFRSLFGLNPVRKGDIKIAVYRGPANPGERWKQGVGMMSENRKEEGLIKNMSIADNITISDLKRFGPIGLIRTKVQQESIGQWIEELDIRCHGPEQSIDELSGGNQQKALFARLLQHGVDLCLLDEPTRGIDVGSKSKIYEVINKLVLEKDEQGLPRKAVIMISSYMPELLGICDKIAVMYKGELSTLKSVSELNEQMVMAIATGQKALG